MDESGCFFKALASKGLTKKWKKCEDGKKSKQRMAVALLLVPLVVKLISQQSSGKAKKTLFFKRTNAASKLKQVSYFADAKSWMQIDIIEKIA